MYWKTFCYAFWKIPSLSELNIQIIWNSCLEHNIKLIIPTRDGELKFFAKIKEELNKRGIMVMVSNYETINVCINKLIFANHKKEIQAIATYENIEKCNFSKYVVKEKFGAGSQSIRLI